jgi:hypothetical protein
MTRAVGVQRRACDSAGVLRQRWSELSPRNQRIVAIGAVEGVLKIAALIDLARRPAAEVRGPKRRWAFAIVLLNTLGLLPLAYFVAGRRRAAA